MKLLLEISYMGTAYHGFQVQENAPTVQKTLQNALEMLCGCDLMLTGCSRTDSGVHAKQFFCTIEGNIPKGLTPEKLPCAAARFLPDDIVLISAVEVPTGFHPRYDVMMKEYEYIILNTAVKNPFFVNRAYHYPQPLDAVKMNLAAGLLVGRHDFRSFMAQGSKIIDTVREIKYCKVSREGGMIRITVAADGFLYNMVRIIAGTLVAVSNGTVAFEDIPGIIAACDRSAAGATLPACGLYLTKVIYKPEKCGLS